MNVARSQKLRGSLGDSWGDAEYESDGGASIGSMSEFESEAESENDPEVPEGAAKDQLADEQDDVATPLPSRVTRASSKTPRDTPVRTPANRISARHSQSPATSPRSQGRSTRSTPGSNSLEPSFIMPSMHGSTDTFYNGSPLRNSQVRSRKLRPSSGHAQPDSLHSSPRISSRRVSQQMAAQHPPGSDVDLDSGLWYYLYLFRQHVLWPALQYVFAVGGLVFEYMKPIFAVGLAAWLLSMALSRTSGFLQATIQNTLSPLCIIPGSSYVVPFCASVSAKRQGDQDPFEVDELIHVQSAFEDIVEASADTSSLPQTMRQSQIAIRDIKSLVRFSKLPSKSELEVEFDSFIELANEASTDLIRYNQKIRSTVDKVISTNKWTLQILQGLSEKEAGVGMIERVASALNPLSVLRAPPLTLHQQVFEQYLKHVTTNREELGNLIQMAQSVLAILMNLDERLDVIAHIATRDNVHVSANRDELLSQLWTKLGGNAATRKDYERQLTLLKQVTSYRKEAVMHVSATLLKAQEIAAGLENLEERVSAPMVLGYRDDVPLTYHVELMGKAVERLEDVMGEARRIDRETYRAPLREEGEDEKGLPGRRDEPPTVYAKIKGGRGRK